MLAHASDDQLLERLLGRPCGNLKLGPALDLDASGLAELGLTGEEASRVLLAAEIARRHQPGIAASDRVTDPRDAVALLDGLRASTTDRTVLLLLDREMCLQDSICISAPSTERSGHCPPIPAEIIIRLLAGHAGASVIVAHNHVNGDARPYVGDIDFTAEVKAATAAAGVELADHVIVAQRGWVSLRKARLFG